MSHVQQAIDKYGGRYKFAKDMQVAWAVANRWYKAGIVPVEHCTKASQLLGVPTRKLNEPVAKVFA